MAYERWFWLHVNESEHILGALSEGKRRAKNKRNGVLFGEKSGSEGRCGKPSFRIQNRSLFDVKTGTSKSKILTSETRTILDQKQTDSGLKLELTSSNPEE